MDAEGRLQSPLVVSGRPQGVDSSYPFGLVVSDVHNPLVGDVTFRSRLLPWFNTCPTHRPGRWTSAQPSVSAVGEVPTTKRFQLPSLSSFLGSRTRVPETSLKKVLCLHLWVRTVDGQTTESGEGPPQSVPTSHRPRVTRNTLLDPCVTGTGMGDE